jgi:cytochrome P450
MAESMRLFPPAWTLERLVVESFEAGGFTIPPGTTILACQYLVHRDPRWWPEPERFDPARWLEPSPHRPKFAYFPFGAGTRACVGEHFAWMEGTLVMATIARRWRMRYLGDRPAVPQPFITLRPRGGMPMELVPR